MTGVLPGISEQDSGSRKRELVDSVLQVTVTENGPVFVIVKEDEIMCDALRKLMAPEIEAEKKKAAEEAQSALRKLMAQEIEAEKKKAAEEATTAATEANIEMLANNLRKTEKGLSLEDALKKARKLLTVAL